MVDATTGEDLICTYADSDRGWASCIASDPDRAGAISYLHSGPIRIEPVPEPLSRPVGDERAGIIGDAAIPDEAPGGYARGPGSRPVVRRRIEESARLVGRAFAGWLRPFAGRRPR